VKGKSGGAAAVKGKSGGAAAVHEGSGFAPVNGARLYYELAGTGMPFVMIHAGVADSRQCNNEFRSFANGYRVLRYDMRGVGRSEPVAGEYTHLADLIALLDYLELVRPIIAMGCSMGGGIAMDYALAAPSAVKSLVMVGSGPSGLTLDVPRLAKFDEIEAAFNAGDLDRACELETRLWFDGIGRTPAEVDPMMRHLAYHMNRMVLAHEAKGLGKRLPDVPVPAAGRLAELRLPVLVVVGEHDTPYIHAAARYMLDRLSIATKIQIADAAHLPNMDHPREFHDAVLRFLETHAST
jgi:pimeloyl-ACP methyl ester carboxylesterase